MPLTWTSQIIALRLLIVTHINSKSPFHYFECYLVTNQAYVHGCEANDGSGQWSIEGHRIVAEEVYDYLLENGLVPPMS